MNDNEEKRISLDILKHLEDLSHQINQLINPRAETVWKRYPVAFGLFILIGGIFLHEGLKGIISDLGLLAWNPLYLSLIGLAILVITGTIYKKLEK